MPLVKRVAARLSETCFQYADRQDLLGAGLTGLAQAIDRYKPEQEATWHAYCLQRVRGAILDEMRRQGGLSRSVYQQRRQWNAARNALTQQHGGAPTAGQMAEALGLQVEHYAQLERQLQPRQFISLNEPLPGAEEADGLCRQDFLPDDRAMGADEFLERKEDLAALRRLVDDLPCPSRQVMAWRYFDNLSFKEIAQLLNLTESRISQLHTAALMRLRRRAEKVPR